MKPLERAWYDLGKPEQVQVGEELIKYGRSNGYVFVFRQDANGDWVTCDWFKEEQIARKVFH